MDVFGEMGWNPVNDHPDSVLMHVINKVHEVFRLPMPRCRSKITDGLIAPGTREWMFGDGHQFHMREMHPMTVINQTFGEVPVIKPAMGATGTFCQLPRWTSWCSWEIATGSSRDVGHPPPSSIDSCADRHNRCERWQFGSKITGSLSSIHSPFWLWIRYLLANRRVGDEKFPNSKVL